MKRSGGIHAYGYTGQRNSSYTGLMDYRARLYDPALKRFIQPDSVIPGMGNPQSLNRYSYTLNSPIVFNDPTGHKVSCEDGQKDDCHSAQTPLKPVPPPANPIKRHLSKDELKVLAVVMYYEYRGYSRMTDSIWKIVDMKFWVFMNLINFRAYEIGESTPLRDRYGTGDYIGSWNPYVAVMGHEAPLKPTLAQGNIAGRYGFDGNYDHQFAALLQLANNDLAKDEKYLGMLTSVKSVESAWYQHGSGSSVDPTGGAVSFVDHIASDPKLSWWIVSDNFEFEPGVTMYTRFASPH